ncbi:MAG: hypothetical protein HBSIN01_35980 [Candidatus Brocadia sinica]|nr:MAG: hypothetical protein HBSIN01_35980 [Candidatus Brocadia sinica]
MDMYLTVIFSNTSQENTKKRRTGITTVILNMIRQVIVMYVRFYKG